MIRFSKTTHGTDGVVLEVSSTKIMHQSVLEKQDAQQLVRNGPSLPKHSTKPCRASPTWKCFTPMHHCISTKTKQRAFPFASYAHFIFGFFLLIISPLSILIGIFLLQFCVRLILKLASISLNCHVSYSGRCNLST